MKTIGQLIHEKRTAAGLTMRHVASALSLSVPYICDIEKGHRTPVVARWASFVAVIPGLTLRALAEGALASGPVEIDARLLTDAQRKPMVAALVRAAGAK